MEVGVHLGDLPGVTAPPVLDGLEIDGFLGRVSADLERTAADVSLSLFGPVLVTCGLDHFLVKDLAGGWHRKLGQPVARRGVQLCNQRVVVGGRQARNRGRLAVGYVLCAGDRVKVAGVGVVETQRPRPAPDPVLGGDLVTVGELHVVAEFEGPGLAVCRDVRHASGSVRDDLQVVVELVQAGEDLGQERDVDRGVYVRRVEARRVVDDGEPQGLVGGKGLRGRATSAAAGRDQRDCSQRAGEGTEQSASRHTTSYETRLEEGAHIRNFAFPESIALFPVARGESAPATDRGHLPMAPLLHRQF